MATPALEKEQPGSLFKRVVETKAFNVLITILIFIGAGNVGLSTYPDIMSQWGTFLTTLDWIIIGCFTVEIMIRIAASTPVPLNYFKDPWNLFDIAIVILCFLPLQNDAVVAIRIIRLLRVMRIFRTLPKLRLLIRGMAHSLTSVGYVAVLLFLHFYIFAVIGVSVFALNDPEHFGNLGNAFLTLFQVLTLENWPDVMAPVKAGHPTGAVIYFVSFIVTGTMVVMNLFVGVIVGGMSEAIEEDKNESAPEKKVEMELRDMRASINKIESTLKNIEQNLKSRSSVT